MENSRVYLQGIDLRTPDEEAPAGIARRLENLYPTGRVDAPVWRTVKGRELFYEEAGLTILSLHVWYRSNFPTLIVYLAKDNSSNALRVYGKEVTPSGQLSGEKVLLHDFGVTYSGHSSRFTQIGDSLIVNLYHESECDDIIVIRMINGTLTALPFNLPDLPEIVTTPSYTQTIEDATGKYEVRKVSVDKEGTVTELSNGFYFGFIYAWKMKDGSIAKCSNVVLRSSHKSQKSTVSVRFVDDRDTTQKVIDALGGRNEDNKELGRHRVEDVSVEAFDFFFGHPTRHVCELTAPVADAKYRELIESVVVFISEPKDSKEAVLREAVFFEYAEFKDVFGTGVKTVKVKFTLEDLFANALLNVDNLLNHNLYPVVLDSYNKMLLMGDVAIDYRKPKIEGTNDTIATADSSYNPWGIILRTALQFDPFGWGTGATAYDLWWYTNNPLAVLYSDVEISPTLNSPTWTPLATNHKGFTLPVTSENATKAFRVRCTYVDGAVSEWVTYSA